MQTESQHARCTLRQGNVNDIDDADLFIVDELRGPALEVNARADAVPIDARPIHRDCAAIFLY